jgi:hypothetical protein
MLLPAFLELFIQPGLFSVSGPPRTTALVKYTMWENKISINRLTDQEDRIQVCFMGFVCTHISTYNNMYQLNTIDLIYTRLAYFYARWQRSTINLKRVYFVKRRSFWSYP